MEKTPEQHDKMPEQAAWYAQKTFWAGLIVGLFLAVLLIGLGGRFAKQGPGMMRSNWHQPMDFEDQMDRDFDRVRQMEMMLEKDGLQIPGKPITSVHLESGMNTGKGDLAFNINGVKVALPYKVADDQLTLNLSQLAKYMKDNPKAQVNLNVTKDDTQEVLSVKTVTDIKTEQVNLEHKVGDLYQLSLQINDENGKNVLALKQTM